MCCKMSVNIQQFRILLVLVFCLLSLSVDLTASSGSRVALIIGNDDYVYARKLKTAVSDATAVAAVLEKNLGFTVILRANTTRDTLTEALFEFLEAARQADAVFIYFAGHGIESDTLGGNYLIPIDAELEKEAHLDSQAYSLNTLLDKINPLPANVRLVTLDSCRDNPVEGRTWSSGRGGGGMRAIDLQRLNAATMVVFSAGPGKTAKDQLAPGDRHSPFASALLQEIQKPGTNAMSLFATVEDSVFQITGQTQRPKVFFTGNLSPFHRFEFSPSSAAPFVSNPSSVMTPMTPREVVAPPEVRAVNPTGRWLIRERVVEAHGGWQIDWAYDFAVRNGGVEAGGRKFRVNSKEATSGDKQALSILSLQPRSRTQFSGHAEETNFRGEKINTQLTVTFSEDGRSLSGEHRQGGDLISTLTGSLQN